MKKTFSLRHVLLLALPLFVAACQKENITQTTKGLPRLEEAWGAYNTPVDGAVRIGGFKAMQTVPSGAHDIRARFWNDQNKTTFLGDLTLDSLVLSPNTEGVYQSNEFQFDEVKSLYGKTVNIQVNDNSGNRTVVLQRGLYVPQDLVVSSPLKQSSSQVLQRNTPVLWNPDPQNTKGVYILIEFDPEAEENAAFNNGVRRYEYNLIQTEDDGVFTLSPDDFSNIPAGAIVDLWVGRGNYLIADGISGIDKYKLYSYSVAYNNFTLGN